MPRPFPPGSLKGSEFIALAALMMSIFALSVDIAIPALNEIGKNLHSRTDNTTQYIISVLVLGMAAGQVFFGPLSDSIGRKPSIIIGLVIFIIGSIITLISTDLSTMLVGRFLQGLGAAGPRIVTIAIVRDQYSGVSMARIMSVIITVFILGPIVAPFIGQGIIILTTWRVIFVFLLILGIIVLTWFAIRQKETLQKSERHPFKIKTICLGIRETCSNQTALGYIIASGCAFGTLFGYITSAEQIFTELYSVGIYFPFYFSSLALAVCVATLSNSRLINRIKMRSLCHYATLFQTILSIAFVFFYLNYSEHPPLFSLMIYLAAMFFCLGILFGNLNALAMEPLGHIAGIAASVIGSMGLFIAILFGTIIGQMFNGTVMPLLIGMAILSSSTMLAIAWANKTSHS